MVRTLTILVFASFSLPVQADLRLTCTFMLDEAQTGAKEVINAEDYGQGPCAGFKDGTLYANAPACPTGYKEYALSKVVLGEQRTTRQVQGVSIDVHRSSREARRYCLAPLSPQAKPKPP